MSKASFLNEMLNNLLKKKTLFKSFKNSVDINDNFSLEVLLQKVLKARGEASSNIVSEQLFDKIENLDDKGLLGFFRDISKKFDIDGSKLLEEAKKFNQNNSAQNLEAVLEISQPKRIEILSKLNSSNKGTIRLVKLREKLFSFLKKYPDLKRVDNDFLKLFKNWFNSGFLILKKIDWSTPALILEKVIEYEAVHEINSWKDLRERLEPHDRLCFSFFHPSMQDEPLIFVVVALMDKVPEKIDDVLSKDRKILTRGSETTAVFYSISNCQIGLKGISFGDFLIKQVANAIRKDYPNIKEFVTLSPVPGFMKWLKIKNPSLFNKINGTNSTKILNSHKDEILKNTLDYFFVSNRSDGFPNDSVTRFHLGNGAILDRINFCADTSAKALNSSAGIMVNYRYDLLNIDENHQMYFDEKILNCSKSILLMKKQYQDKKKLFNLSK